MPNNDQVEDLDEKINSLTAEITKNEYLIKDQTETINELQETYETQTKELSNEKIKPFSENEIINQSNNISFSEEDICEEKNDLNNSEDIKKINKEIEENNEINFIIYYFSYFGKIFFYI